VVMMVSINKTLSGSLSTTLQPMCDKINLFNHQGQHA
jgi:hypothetical protein